MAKSIGKQTKATAKTTKKMSGKSVLAEKVPEYKPTIYLDDKQIPSALKGAKVGSSVNVVVTGKIIGKSERTDKDGTSNSMQIEVGKMDVAKKGGK